jgi:hypothetical protein
MHLGPSAHRLMATEIYHGIDGVLLNPKEPVARPTSKTNSDELAPKTDAEPKRHSRRGFAA